MGVSGCAEVEQCNSSVGSQVLSANEDVYAPGATPSNASPVVLRSAMGTSAPSEDKPDRSNQPICDVPRAKGSTSQELSGKGFPTLSEISEILSNAHAEMLHEIRALDRKIEDIRKA